MSGIRLTGNLVPQVGFLPTLLPNPTVPTSLAFLWLSHLSQHGPPVGVDMASCTYPSVPLMTSMSEEAYLYCRPKWFFPLVSCQNHFYCRESNLFHELIYHHYLQYKFWSQSRPGNFIDAQSGTEPRSPWISRAGFALLTTTNVSLTKLPEKRWLGKFSTEGNLSVTGVGYFYPYNSMLMKLVGMTPDWKRVLQGAGRSRKHWSRLVFKVIFSSI